MAKQWKIFVNKGDEYSAKSNDDIYRDDIFFADVYEQARYYLNEILQNSNARIAGSLSSVHPANTNSFLMGMSNNIIAFCAERGQGKTSAMLSFSHALKELSLPDSQTARCAKFWEGTHVPAYHYEVLYNIDPTIMTDSDSILKVIISQMFEHYRQLYEAHELPRQKQQQQRQRYMSSQKECFSSYDINPCSDYEDLMLDFQKCFHSVEVLMEQGKLHDEKELLDDLERIADLGDSSNLRSSLYLLIAHYLDAVTSEKDSFLVIQIDDADTAISKAYRILEDVRKYLMLPRVIILFATNMVQLESVVEQHFLSEYRESLSHKGSMVTVERCHEIANLYLEKTLPNTHRIELPDLNKALQESYTQIQLCYQSEDTSTANLLATPYSDWCEQEIVRSQQAQEKARSYGEVTSKFYLSQWSYQEQLLHFLHQKTGLFFMSEKGRRHEFLPSSMRELTHFLAYFSALPSLPSEPYDEIITCFSHSQKSSDALKLWKNNLKLLEHYLVDLWSSTNLIQSARSLFRSFCEVSPSQMNSFLLKNLPEYCALEQQRSADSRGFSAGNTQGRFLALCQRYGIPKDKDGNLSAPVTYGAVNAMLSALTDMPDGARHRKLAYAIRLYYTIRFHLVLLDDLETAPSDTPRLTSFMADTPLYFGMDDTFSQNSLFWHLHIRKADLALTYPNYSSDTLWAKYAGRFLRQEFSDFNGRYTMPLGEKTWILYSPYTPHDGRYVFNPLYYLMYELDQIALAPLSPEAEKDSTDSESKVGDQRTEYQSNQTLRGQMRTAFIILLNADVQISLFQKLLCRNADADSLESALHFYTRDVFFSTLFSACDLNVIPTDGRDFKEDSVRYGEAYKGDMLSFRIDEPEAKGDCEKFIGLIQQSLFWNGDVTKKFYVSYYSKQCDAYLKNLRSLQNSMNSPDFIETDASSSLFKPESYQRYLPYAFQNRPPKKKIPQSDTLPNLLTALSKFSAPEFHLSDSSSDVAAVIQHLENFKQNLHAYFEAFNNKSSK